jgi:hypothetical protein
MKKIVLLTEPDRVDPFLLERLKELFPECDIQVVFKADAERFPGERGTAGAAYRS